MTFSEDLSVFFADFGEACTVNGVSGLGIFDKVYLESFGVLSGNNPVILISDALLGSAAEGSAVVVRSTNYTIAAIEPDGTGLTLLRMQS